MAVSGFLVETIGTFASVDGGAYEIHLLKKGYGGASSEVTLQADPLTIDWGLRGAEIYTPILASNATSNNWRLEGTELLGLIGAKSGDYLMEVLRESSRVWVGRVETDIYQQSTMSGPSSVQVKAIDGIAALENVRYTDTSGPSEAAYEGRENFLTIFLRCVNKLDYQLPVRIACNLFAEQAASTSVDPFVNLEIDQEIFYNEEGEAWTCYDIIRVLMYGTKCQLFQRDGSWNIIARELMDGSGYTVYKYTSGGSANGTEADGVAIDIDTLFAAEDVDRLQGHLTLRQQYGGSSVRYDHGPIPSLIDFGDFRLVPDQDEQEGHVPIKDAEDYWIVANGSGGDAEIRQRVKTYSFVTGGIRVVGATQVARKEGYLWVEGFMHGGTKDLDDIREFVVDVSGRGEQLGRFSIEEDDIIAFLGNIELKHTGSGTPSEAGLFNTLYELNIWGSNWYLANDGTWFETADSYERAQYLFPPGNKFRDDGIQLNTPTDFRIISEPAPVAGPIFVKLWGTSDFGVEPAQELSVEAAYWDDLEVLFVDESGEILTVIDYEYYDDSLEPFRESVSLPFGQGPKSNVPGRLTWDGVNATGFGNGTTAGDQEHGDIIAEGLIRSQLRPLTARHETYRLAALQMGVPFTVDSKTLAPIFLSKDYYHGIDKVEGVEVRYDVDALANAKIARDDAPTAQRASGNGQLGASLAGFMSALSRHNPLAYLAEDHPEGDIEELVVVKEEGAFLKSSDFLVVVDAASGFPTMFRVAAEEVEETDPMVETETIEVEDLEGLGDPVTTEIEMVEGSGVYFGHRDLVRRVRDIENLIASGKCGPSWEAIAGKPFGTNIEEIDIGGITYELYGKKKLAELPPYYAKLTIPSSKVASDIDDFPVRVNLSDMPGHFWEHVTIDGSRRGEDIRVTVDSGGSPGDEVPREVVFLDRDGLEGLLFFKADLLSASDNVFYIHYGEHYTEPEPDAVNGRYGVWEDELAVWHLNGKDYRDSAEFERHMSELGSGDLFTFESFDVSPDIDSKQGIAFDGSYYYTINTDEIKKYDLDWNLVSENTDPFSELTGPINYLEDCVVCGTGDSARLLVPAEYYNGCGDFSDMRIVQYDPSDLSFVYEFDVSAQGHEVTGLHIDNEKGYAVLGSFCQDDRLYLYNLINFEFIGELMLSEDIPSIQGISELRGKYYINSGSLHQTIEVEKDGTVNGAVYEDTEGVYQGIYAKEDYLMVLIDKGSGQRKVHSLRRIADAASGNANIFDGLNYLKVTDAQLQIVGDLTVSLNFEWDGTEGKSILFGVSGGGGEIPASNELISIWISFDDPDYKLNFTHESGNGVNETGGEDAVAFLADTRYKLDLVRDATAREYEAFLDGVSVGTFGYTNNPTRASSGSLQDTRIGHAGWDTGLDNQFKGSLSDVRYVADKRSSAYIALTYDNETDPSFYSIVQENPAP